MYFFLCFSLFLITKTMFKRFRKDKPLPIINQDIEPVDEQFFTILQSKCKLVDSYLFTQK